MQVTGADDGRTSTAATQTLLVRRTSGRLAVVSDPEGQAVASLETLSSDLIKLTVDGVETVRIDGAPIVKALIGADISIDVGESRDTIRLDPITALPSKSTAPAAPAAPPMPTMPSIPSLMPDARTLRPENPSTNVRPNDPSPSSPTGVGPRPPPISLPPVARSPSTSTSSPQPSGKANTSLQVHNLTVTTKGVTRLDGIDFTMTSGSFLTVLGTSGAGKSTLVKALTGVDPATDGFVVFDGVDMYQQFEAVRSRIGYVPQDDILHQQLTVRETLEFAARLRFPTSTTDAIRSARIDAVIGELGLTARVDARVDELSGGQRKRVNVAVELLTEPALLILDEPTSGLDPGNERLMMELLRKLADGGRMVIAVTHSMESLHLCDDVLFLAPGGIPVYLGAPADLPSRLGASNYTEVFTTVERMVNPSAVRVARASSAVRPIAPPRPATSMGAAVRSADIDELGRQFRILVERYVRVISSDRRNLLILALQAPIIGVVMLAVFGSGHLDETTGGVSAGNVLMGLSLATVYLGASNSVREIVKERSILRREQNFGLSIVAYLGSKFAVLGVITTAQAGMLVAAGLLRQSGPQRSVLLGQAHIELLALIVVCGLSAPLALGLLISAWSSSADKAMTMLPVLLFMQFLLAGLIFPVSTIGVQQISWFTSTRWGFAGAASTADFWELRACGLPAVECSSLWRHESGYWLLSYTMLCVLTGAALYLAWWLITRRDPVNILTRVGSDHTT